MVRRNSGVILEIMYYYKKDWMIMKVYIEK